MPDYPKRFTGEPDDRWPEDRNEDYKNASSDDERRQILLECGVDRAHYGDMIRLFGPHDPDDPQWKW